MMRFLAANIVEVVIWRRFYRYLHLPFRIPPELLALPVVEGRSVAIHLPVRPEVCVEKINKERKSINVRKF
jgi:hypothetical protein